VPDLVAMYQQGDTMLDSYVTHTLNFDGEWRRAVAVLLL
jgi:Zn-dependent alcohol dehydrogenase